MLKNSQIPNAKPRFDVLVTDTFQNATGRDQTNWIRVYGSHLETSRSS